MSREDLVQYFAVNREIKQRVAAGVLQGVDHLSANNAAWKVLEDRDEMADAALYAAEDLIRKRIYALGYMVVADREFRNAVIAEHLEATALKIYEVFSALPTKRKEESSRTTTT